MMCNHLLIFLFQFFMFILIKQVKVFIIFLKVLTIFIFMIASFILFFISNFFVSFIFASILIFILSDLDSFSTSFIFQIFSCLFMKILISLHEIFFSSLVIGKEIQIFQGISFNFTRLMKGFFKLKREIYKILKIQWEEVYQPIYEQKNPKMIAQ